MSARIQSLKNLQGLCLHTVEGLLKPSWKKIDHPGISTSYPTRTMPSITIMEVYGAETIKEFESMVTGLGWQVNREEIYTIVRWTKEANIQVRPSLKGLIYETETGVICAPGIPIPIEPEQRGTQEIMGYSRALDGIMIRFWAGAGGLMWSTNGTIYPGYWQGEDITSLVIHLLEAGEVKSDYLFYECRAGWCYCAVLEHPALVNIYMPSEPRLTLVRVMDEYGTSFPLDSDTPFKYVNRVTKESPISLATLTAPYDDGYVGPVTRDTYGVVAHLYNGDTYRLLSEPAKTAERLRPNYRELWQHWIHNVRETGGPADWELPGSKMALYKTYFPWNVDAMEGLSAYFDFLVPEEEQTLALKSNRKLRDIATQYHILLDEAGTYETNEDGVAVTSILGDFPDSESADHYIAWLLAKPKRLIEFLDM